jgi:hypothetical protein
MKKHWLIGGLAGVFALTGLAFVQGGGTQPSAAAGGTTLSSAVQPIAFPHNQHAGSEPGQGKMDCQFCHFSAERSVDAGIPSVATCWGCHQLIPGANNPQEVAKIKEYLDAGEGIPWVRIYKVSDHVHFPHMRHVNAGLTCQQCHGEIQTMQVLEPPNRGIVGKLLLPQDPVWGGDNMGWCVECHRQPNESGVQQASTDCAVCHY